MNAPTHGIAAALLVAATTWLPQDPAPARARDDPDAGCRVCHPAAVDGLRLSRHRALLSDAATCTACHEDAGAHAASARRAELELVPAGPVLRAACVRCHGDVDWPTRSALHPWVRSEEVARAELDGRAPIEPPALPDARGLGSFGWSGAVQLGYRFVSRSGSVDRFDTDLDLEPGLRLVEGRITGTGSSDWLDRVELGADDVGDPWTRLRAELAKDGLYEAAASREERVLVHRTRGDYDRVEREERTTAFQLDVDLGDALGLWGDFTRFHDDGVWLTRRIGGRGIAPQTFVPGVTSPRRTESDEVNAGLRGVLLDTGFRAGVGWLDERTDDRWSFARPAPGNPLVVESEDFRSVAVLEGPTALLSLDRDFDGLRIEADARWRELDRDVDARGTRTGFDTLEFETDTTSVARGEARTAIVDLDAIADLGDDAALLLDLSWREHRERMDLSQVDVTRFPVAGGGVTTRDDRAQRTAQRRVSGALELEVEPLDGVTLSAGWGFVREELRLPDLVLGDADAVGGTIRDDGAIAGAEWRFAEGWRVRARYTDFGQSGLLLHEQREDEARTGSVSLRWERDAASVEVFARHRFAANDLARFRSEQDAFGATATWSGAELADLFASWVLTDTDSRTLTTFYFDPDPTPVPTIVGFEGDTHSATLGVSLWPDRPVQWRNDASLTDTSGSFDVATWRLRSEVTYAPFPGGRLGVRWEHLEYDEQGGLDDWEADLVMVTWRQSFGSAAR